MGESELGSGGLRDIYVTVFLYNFAVSMVVPAITDVTMLALCPGQDECSFAIYLTGFQQAVIGFGNLLLMPLIGNLSDSCGRKTLLTLPMTLSILPIAILACGRTKLFFYGYYVLKTITAMFCEGSVQCLSLAYVADNISEKRRASAFGLVWGVTSSAYVCGSLAARFLSTHSTFQVSTIVAILATLYMRYFLTDSYLNNNDCSSSRFISNNDDLCPKKQVGKRIPSLKDMILLLRSSLRFRQAAIIAFLYSLAEGGQSGALMYFLKARFHFNKNQFADITLIMGVALGISQLLIMPALAPGLGDETLLGIALLAGGAHMFLTSVSWAPWVPYVANAFSILSAFSCPCIRTIASRQVGTEEQGMAQGCIAGISSFANILSPLVFSPLTALFLSERAPLHFQGFSIMCTGLVMIIAFVQSLMIREVPSSSQKTSNICTEA